MANKLLNLRVLFDTFEEIKNCNTFLAYVKPSKGAPFEIDIYSSNYNPTLYRLAISLNAITLILLACPAEPNA